MKVSFQKMNKILGWGIFFIAAFVYVSTVEPTVSLWDCGEYISTAYKLQVGHPPGAPLFQLLGRVFSLFALGNTSKVAYCINVMSAVASALTVMFLFWSIVLLASQFLIYNKKNDSGKEYLALGMGLSGALAYLFTDSFWFSAVEAEVYALSSLFTAVVFWAILRWNKETNDSYRIRWLILIAYLIGLSIGVHQLNLLTIPAIVLVIYFRKKKPNVLGVLGAILLSMGVLAFILYGLVPEIPGLFARTELFVVNRLGFPFESGTIFSAIVLVGLLLVGILYTHYPNIYFRILFGVLAIFILVMIVSGASSWVGLIFRFLFVLGLGWGIIYLMKHRVVMNAVWLSLCFIVIGYSSFLMIVIRANANTPINENNPRDAMGLVAYLNREQYGNWPVIYGSDFTANVVGYTDGKPVYMKDEKTGRYKVKDNAKSTKPIYDSHMLFPRMYSQSYDHIQEYKIWAGMPNDENYKPGFGDHLRFLVNYQLNHMYWRYFLWNFAGRQNDQQGFYNKANGNWITGLNFLDKWRVGPLKELPAHKKSKAWNRFYLLPLLFGIGGAIYHYKRNWKGWLVIMAFFIMTGMAIIIYLNQYSPQPRERDYAYAASFYAFAIWIGLGTGALASGLTKWMNDKKSILIATSLNLLCVSGVLAAEGWNDHNRSGRYTTLQMAKAYLDSCAPNAILFTYGDNDTFPLWYVQEVENYRTDVRVCNFSLLSLDWYIEQMKRKVYESEPLPIKLDFSFYKQGTHDFIYFITENDSLADTLNLKQVFEQMKIEPQEFKYCIEGDTIDYLPSNHFVMNVDKTAVLKGGTVDNDTSGRILNLMIFDVPGGYIEKNALIALNIIANNNWERPIYFGLMGSSQEYLGLEKYFQLEGMAYRLVPILSKSSQNHLGNINSAILYENLMNSTQITMNDPTIFYSDDHQRYAPMLRNVYARLADTLLHEGKNELAVKVCDRCVENLPNNVIPYDVFSLSLAEVYYRAAEILKANELLTIMMHQASDELEYYFKLSSALMHRYKYEINLNLGILNYIAETTRNFGQTTIADQCQADFESKLQYYSTHIYQNLEP